MTNRKAQYWVIPPEADAEFAAGMEDVLDTYSRPYDPAYPVVCMDEQPIQLTREIRERIPESRNHPERIDYEYERAGTACVFIFTEPLAGWRSVVTRPRRRKVEWALEIKDLLCSRYRDAEKLLLVCDNLNTHTRGAFYEAFEAPVARELVKRIEFHYTPKHGSWLNIAENELSSLTRQCLADRRFADIETLNREVSAWAAESNKLQRDVDWQFNIENARAQLKSLYPKL